MIKLKELLLLTEVACGKCFSWAYRRVLKGGPLLTLVHGTTFVPFLGKRIGHAWIETKTKVFDWQNHESLGRKQALVHIGLWVDADDKTKLEYYRKGFPKNLYYKMTKAKVDEKYKKMEAAMAMVHNKHYGPWD